MFLYQKTGRYFAQIAGGLEEMGVEELTSLGAKRVQPDYRGIHFDAGQRVLHRLNYHSRLVTRVLAPLKIFTCANPDSLYKHGKEIAWDQLLSTKDTFAITANTARSKISHSQYAALRLKDAIVDRFRETDGDRPNVRKIDPDVWINLHIDRDRATVSLDTSGGSLHRRGYRRQAGKAPMQETVAAAILILTEWDGERPLHDPMCGAGTLLAEALMRYCRIPSGFLRERFGFERLPDFSATVWQTVRREAEERIRPLPSGLIRGGDIRQDQIEMTRENLSLLPSGEDVIVSRKDFRDVDKSEDRTIITNPPFGVRLDTPEGPDTFFKDFGDFLKQRCTGSAAYVYFGNREYIKKIGLRSAWKKPLANGGLDGRLVKYELY